MKVIHYARVSSDRQDIDLSIGAQLKALQEYSSRNGYIVVKEYIDEALSGRSIDRPGFREMIAAARQKPAPFDAILVWKLSRFARNREDSIVYKSLLRKQGIQVISINEPVEDTPSGRLLEGILETIDEFYSANLSQDVIRGMKENAVRGFRNGGRAPFGYVRVNIHDGATTRVKLGLDPDKALIVQRIFRDVLAGKGLRTIARDLNADGLVSAEGGKWSMTSIEGVIRNEAYTGQSVWGKHGKRSGTVEESTIVKKESAWPAIVDRTTFDMARSKVAARAPKFIHPRQVDSRYLLSGLMRCGICGAAMVGRSTHHSYYYYLCGTINRKGREACRLPTIPKNGIEAFVINRIKDYVLREDNVEELVRLTNGELNQSNSELAGRVDFLQAQIAEVSGRLEKLYDLIETGEFNAQELSPRIRGLQEKREELQKAKYEAEETLKANSADRVDPNTIRKYASELQSLLDRSPVDEQKNLLRSFVDKIEMSESEVKLHYKIPVLASGSPQEEVNFLPFIRQGEGAGGEVSQYFLSGREVSLMH